MGTIKIFLSYASEQHKQAERLAIALRGRRHKVFLDQDDLPPGGDYHSRIRRAVNECDLFCFLISPQSITAGRFTLSELGFARRRWPNPAGRVLPIMIEEVSRDLVPPYLQAVTILEPQGNFVADTLAGVEALRQPARWHWVTIGEVSVLAAALVAGTLYFLPRDNSQQVPHPPPKVRLVGGMGGTYNNPLTCVPGEVLRGFYGTKAIFFQQLGVICGKFGSTETSRSRPLGLSRGPDDWVLVCPPDSVITGARIAASPYRGGSLVVGSLQLRCGQVQSSGNGESLVNPLHMTATDEVSGTGMTDNPVSVDCPQGEMVTTAHVRSGSWIDALGIECGKVASVNIVN